MGFLFDYIRLDLINYIASYYKPWHSITQYLEKASLKIGRWVCPVTANHQKTEEIGSTEGLIPKAMYIQLTQVVT